MDVVLHPHSLTCKIFITDKFPVICNEVSGVFLDAAFYAHYIRTYFYIFEHYYV